MEKRYLSFREFCLRYGLKKDKGYEYAPKACIYFAGEPVRPYKFDQEVTDRLFTTPTESSSLKTEAMETTRRAPAPRREKACL